MVLMRDIREFTFEDLDGTKTTIYPTKIRHPSMIITGISIKSMLEESDHKLKHMMRYGNYDYITYDKGSLILKNESIFYLIPSVTLYRGNVFTG